MKQKMSFKEHSTIPLVHALSHLALSGTAIILVLGSANALTCHCLYNSACKSDGSCPNGCEKGWYGPGCQLGNLALGKLANQSSVFQSYTANLAVNGAMPPLGDTSVIDCSHTAESYKEPLWWYVKLSDTEDFVIRNVTIVGRQGTTARFLRWFYILYTTSLSGDPDPVTWKTCNYQASATSSTVTTFGCIGGIAIGRRVAIYIGSHPEDVQMLIICEVYVDGYAYKESSSFQDLQISVTPGCNSVKVDFETLPVVPPSYFYVNIRPADGKSAPVVKKVRYPLSGKPSTIMPATPNRMYTLWILPETCCIGYCCVNNGDSYESLYCINGTSSGILITTTPQYEHYSLTVSANVVNVTALNLYPCTASVFNIQCNRAPVPGNFPSVCYGTSCQLNPYYNYTCTLQVNFEDGSRQTSLTSVNFGAADFTPLDVLSRTTCNKVYVELEALASRWNMNPSFIIFFKKALVDNQTTIKRVAFAKSDRYAVEFLADEDSSHSVWAAPEICWSKTVCDDDSDRACFDSSKCAIGQNTTIKNTMTKVRQYSFKMKDCCLSIDEQSHEACEDPDYLKITCSDGENNTYESSGIIGRSICGILTGSDYMCQIDAWFANMTVKNTSYMLKNESLQRCQLNESTQQQNVILIIVGACGSGVVLIVLIALAVVLPLRKRNAKKKKNKDQTATKNRKTISKNEAHIEEEYCNNYAYSEDNQEQSQREDGSSQIHAISNDYSDEYYVSHISELQGLGNTKESQMRHTYKNAMPVVEASYVNDREKQRELSKTVASESYADHRLQSQKSRNSDAKEVLQDITDLTAPRTKESGDSEEVDYMNTNSHQQSELAFTPPAGSITYSNTSTDCESAIPNPSDDISYISSESALGISGETYHTKNTQLSVFLYNGPYVMLETVAHFTQWSHYGKQCTKIHLR